MQKMENRKNWFDWSLKPLIFCTQIFVGYPLNFTNIKNSKTIFSNVIIYLLGSVICLSNLLINGTRGINVNNFDWMSERLDYYSSPYLFFREFPDAMLQFVVDATTIIFFVTVPLIHLIFIITVICSQKWADLLSVLQEIQNKMKLDEEFHRKIRRYCIFALLLLFFVSIL